MRVAKFTKTLGGVAICAGLAACSGGGSGGPTALTASPEAACTLIGRLSDTGELVEKADISDPEAFESALDDAVAKYVATIDDLRKVAPDDLRDDLDRLQAAVEQYDFDDAFAARAPLDEYADAECTEDTTTTGS
ncbi:MAG TPA: hypothetical protein VFX21_16995 [Acidimicrobiia bacterium]|nr:hypothetical protein [Acidimicrobiia bacterium]